jgi:serine/threonine protein kinase
MISSPSNSNHNSEKPSDTPGAFPQGMLPEVNQIVGKNRILQHIATGGIAVVYKVFNEELEVVRAIKMLKPGYTRETMDRFQTEAKITANLHHPNIVQIYHVDIWKVDIPYFEMEYIDGTSLLEVLQKSYTIACPLALSIAISVCEALDYAQNQSFTVYGKTYAGLVHRDIKPANILLSKNGAIKLADFGIALPGSVSLHTIGPYTMGTFAYLSPEQMSGEKLDCRSDIYSLGTVLYEMVSGRKAFPQQSVAELVQMKQKGKYSPAQNLDAQIPKSYAAITEKCMSLNKEKRFPSARNLSDALKDALAQITSDTPSSIIQTHVRTPQPAGPKARIKTRHRLLFLNPMLHIAIILSGILISTVLVILSKRISDEPAPKSAALPGAGTSPPSVQAAPLSTVEKNGTISSPPKGIPNPTTTAVQRTGAFAGETSDSFSDAAPPENLQAGLTAFQERNYSSAIVHLEKALDDAPDNNTISIILIRLFESNLLIGNKDKAREFAEKELVNDGYYYYLKGKTFFQAGELDKAEAAINKAQTTPSIFGPTVLGESVYLGAQNYQAIYLKKPNLINKSNSLRAWQNVRRIMCGGDTTLTQVCVTAEEVIRVLSH